MVEVKRFNVATYNPVLPTEDRIRTISHLAPKGSKVYASVRLLPKQHYRMRLYSVHPTWDNGKPALVEFDQQVNERLFWEIVNRQAYDADQIDYYGFNHTDGTDHAGFGWPPGVYSNVALGIIYALAEIVHGDRNAWRVELIK